MSLKIMLLKIMLALMQVLVKMTPIYSENEDTRNKCLYIT